MTIKKIINTLKAEIKNYTPTLIDTIIKEYGNDPFLILICCLLSLRSKDSVTIHICRALLKIAKTPQQLLDIPRAKLEKIIFKIGFYRSKAKVLHQVCNALLKQHSGKVPKTELELLALPGVGRKTANLVLGIAFNIPSICVDIHVHRISNRLGLIKTKTAEQTELALKKLLDKKYWVIWNDLLVKWGQNICTPLSPWCSKCSIKKLCKMVAVNKSR